MSYIANLYKERFVLQSLVVRDFKARYRRSILGIAWTLLTPLGTVAVIGAVYAVVFNAKFEDFIPQIFTSLIPWYFFAACADTGTSAFINAEGFITQTKTSIEIFPVRVAFGAFFHYLISMFALVLVLIFINY